MEKAKNLKYGMGVLAYVLLIGLFFLIGYLSGSIHGRNMQRELMENAEAVNTSSYAGVYEEDENPEDSISVQYELSLSDGILTVSKREGDDIISIAQCTISEEVYPRADIETLRRGMRFEDRKEALSVFEDFVS